MEYHKINKLIFCAYAYDTNKKTGENINKSNQFRDIYYKNCIVSLFSAKKNNPYADVGLITNYPVPDEYKNILIKNGIKIFLEDYNEFCFDDRMPWSLAFYKLCALKKALRYQYDFYLMLDTDTYVQNSLEDMWNECTDNILLYDINQRFNSPNYQGFNKEISSFLGKEQYVISYGGEFIAGSKQLLCKFINSLEKYYNKMQNEHFQTSYGDEFLTRLAALENKQIIKNASGYVFRYWTGAYYLVSTNFYTDAVSVLHVPREKELGMLKAYKYIISHEKLPSNNLIYRYFHLRRGRVNQCLIKCISNMLNIFNKRK